MDYEEKYKEALERAKRLRESKYQTMNAKRVVDEIFPQLAESEDERIIEGFHTLIRGIRRTGGLTLNKVPLDKCEAWLEKQKESLHIQKTCKENADSFTDGIIEVRSFQRGMEEGRRLEKQKEQKDYRKLYDDIAKSDWFKKAYHGKSLGVEDEQKEQKPAEWSEEDERKRQACISTINEVIDYERERWEDYNPGKPYRPIMKYDEQIDWLKSLRPSWKPSEEQMMDEWLKDRDGCFWDGVEEGKKAMEQQMLKKMKMEESK